MNTRRAGIRNLWLTLAKIFIFLIALYFAYLILRPLLSILLGVGFLVIKVIVFLTVTLLVIHLFLHLIFGISMLTIVFRRSRR